MTQLNKSQCLALLSHLGKMEIQEMDSDLASAYFAIKRIELNAPITCDLPMNRYRIQSNGYKIAAIKAIRMISGFDLLAAKGLLALNELECKPIILESPVVFEFSDFLECKGISIAINTQELKDVEYDLRDLS